MAGQHVEHHRQRTQSVTGSAVDDSGKLAALLANAKYILLDFDGPVCKVFAGLSAATIADELRQLVTGRGFELPAELHDTGDPLAILRWAADEDDDLAHLVDRALTDAEVRAVATAEPTPGSREFLEACNATGRPVAIVSNNSAEAIRAYLDRTRLGRLVAHVEGRDHDQPIRMKPDPFSATQALSELSANPREAAFLGDSDSDLQAAHASGVSAVALANKARKIRMFGQMGADIIITNMASAVEALEPGPQINGVID